MVTYIFACAFIILAALLVVRYRSDLRAIRHQIAGLGSRVIDTACGPIEYAERGSGEPVLVIHGIAGGFDQGLGLAQTLVGDDYRVIAPSRFGYLRTPLPADASVASQADAYACLLDALNIHKVVVVTSSAGATSSIQFAIRHPERVIALILHSPNAPGKVEMKLPPRPVFDAMFHSDFIFWALMTYSAPSMRSFAGVPAGFVLSAEMDRSVNAVLRSVLPSNERADGMIFDNYISNPEINQMSFGAVQAPTLVVSALDDPMALHENAQALANLIPRAKLIAIPDGGHIMLGHEEEVQNAIISFINSQIASN